MLCKYRGQPRSNFRVHFKLKILKIQKIRNQIMMSEWFGTEKIGQNNNIYKKQFFIILFMLSTEFFIFLL